MDIIGDLLTDQLAVRIVCRWFGFEALQACLTGLLDLEGIELADGGFGVEAVDFLFNQRREG